MPFNIAAKNVMLDALDESATQITHIGAHTVTDPGTGADANSGEATGGSYARQAVTWAAASGGQKSNSGALSIPVPAGSYAFLTFWNASTANSGNYRGYAPINSTVKGFGTVDTAGITSDAIQSAGHGLADGDRVMVFNVLGESLPTGLTEGTIYYVVSATTDTFDVSATLGGSSVNVTGQGELFFQKVIPETFGADGTITVAIDALVLDNTGI
ncbi:hypothetical protein OG884_05870 [Streptosporangium sp. NBC_01755]|uniref:phage tail fiber protein n=1 Tax=Streptosporangium sp. NBC_01755 TaxID=2975949 RepID=UPI002DDA044F|nr:hypothetical protein [Streptosporangium sp. NBC_01755]WSD01453.1 hypothetical protein OG884_05870 [Streptosporangium sp. NBC_01755]